jgi:phosphatidylinositol 4-phosphatase
MSLLYYFLLWFTLLIGSTTFIFLHGTEYVSWPRLIPPVDVLMYTGPGYRARYDGTDVGVAVIDEKKAKWLTQGRYRAEARIEEVEKGGRKRYD